MFFFLINIQKWIYNCQWAEKADMCWYEPDIYYAIYYALLCIWFVLILKT